MGDSAGGGLSAEFGCELLAANDFPQPKNLNTDISLA